MQSFAPRNCRDDTNLSSKDSHVGCVYSPTGITLTPPPAAPWSCTTSSASSDPELCPDGPPQRPNLSPEAHHRRAYEKRVAAWSRVDTGYMRHPEWCEHRVIMLFQEAFRPEYDRLQRGLRDGSLPRDEFLVRRDQLKTALDAMKCEYRRTLQRLRDQNATGEKFASIAAKAATCVASVYPWSSDGFFMTYSENMRFGQIVHPTTVCGIAAVAASSKAATRPPPRVSPVPEAALHRPSGGPPRPLQPLPPPRKLGVQRSVAADGTVVLASTPPARPPSLKAFSPPPPGTNNCGSPTALVFASPLATPGSPPRQLPLAVTGPIRADEMRFLERKQLVQTPHAFCVRSLAATSFVGARRSTVANHTTRSRLAAAVAGIPRSPSEPTLLSIEMHDEPEEVCDEVLLRSPHSHTFASADCTVSPEEHSVTSESSLGDSGTYRRLANLERVDCQHFPRIETPLSNSNTFSRPQTPLSLSRSENSSFSSLSYCGLAPASPPELVCSTISVAPHRLLSMQQYHTVPALW